MKQFYFLLFTFCLISGGAIAQGTETFENHNLGTSYTDGSFVGDNGVTWNYVQSRDENADDNGSGIVGKAVMLRRVSDASVLSALSGANGVGAISMKLYKGFTGSGDRQVEVFVNGVSFGTSTPFNDFDEHDFILEGINVAGDVTIEIKNITTRQIIVDTVVWTAKDVTLSVNKNNATTYSVYPNPATNGFVTISSATSEAISVSVYDVLGKQVLSKTLTNNRLNVSSLNAGMYILNITQNGKSVTKKLVIK